MNRKLIYKTQKTTFIYLFLLLIVVAPIFYFIAHKFYLKEIDEILIQTKAKLLHTSILGLKEKDIPIWNSFNSDIKLQKSTGLAKDTIFNKLYFNDVEKEYEPYRLLYAPVRIEANNYNLSIRSSLLESRDFLLAIISLFVLILVILFSGILFISYLLSARLWKPFYQTIEQIENFKIDKHQELNLIGSGVDEFNRLNKSIKNLIERNILIYNNQREFIENAAHELQTPIAIFQAKVDSLIQRPDLTKGQSEILTSLNDSISRLNRLNKNLLLLSKIDKQTLKETESFSLKELIEKNLDFYKEQANQKSIVTKVYLQNEVNLNTNKAFVEIMVNNLLLNAISHNVKNGEINISLDENNLNISNTGKNKKLLLDKLFSRFSKENASMQGNGLGLAIVKKIADLNNWSITYSFSESKHSFCVHFHNSIFLQNRVTS